MSQLFKDFEMSGVVIKYYYYDMFFVKYAVPMIVNKTMDYF